MAQDFDDFMNDWLKDVEDIAKMSPSDQADITNAGAKVLAKEYEKSARSHRHISTKADDRWGHLADTVKTQNKNIDGVKDGTSSVGWGDSLNAAKARWLNNGTIHIKGDNWLTNTRDSHSVQQKVFRAEQKEFAKKIKQKGHDKQ